MTEKMDKEFNDSKKDAKIMKHLHSEIEKMKKDINHRYEVVQALAQQTEESRESSHESEIRDRLPFFSENSNNNMAKIAIEHSNQKQKMRQG